MLLSEKEQSVYHFLPQLESLVGDPHEQLQKFCFSTLYGGKLDHIPINEC